MLSAFTVEPIPTVTYKLRIFNKFKKEEKLAEYHLSFFTELEEGVRPVDFLGQLQDHLAELLDNLKEQDWTPENIGKVVEELMCDNPLSYQSFEANELENKRIVFYVK